MTMEAEVWSFDTWSQTRMPAARLQEAHSRPDATAHLAGLVKIDAATLRHTQRTHAMGSFSRSVWCCLLLSVVGRPAEVTVMTQNLYIGASLSRVLAALAPNAPAVPTLEEAIAETVAIAAGPNNFDLRVGAIAESINTAKPDLVALQEVTQVQIAPGGVPMTILDFRPTLTSLLPDYEVAIETADADFTLPAGALRTSNLILKRNTRTDLVVSNPRSGIFVSQGFSVAGQPSQRNWQTVDVTVGGKRFILLNTHLESDNATASTAQARELVAGPLNTKTKVVAVGDFNSGPGQTLGAYNVLTKQGKLKDLVKAGNTCCHAELLTQPETVRTRLLERIDLVLSSPSISLISGKRVNVNQVPTPAPNVSIYPSDHTGVVAKLRFP